jgi:hypothetical protein
VLSGWRRSRLTRSGWSTPPSVAVWPPTPSRVTVSVSASPSRRLAAAPGRWRAGRGRAARVRRRPGRGRRWPRRCAAAADQRPLVLGQVLQDVALLMPTTPMDRCLGTEHTSDGPIRALPPWTWPSSERFTSGAPGRAPPQSHGPRDNLAPGTGHPGYIEAISLSTRSSCALKGSLHKTVRWAWSLSLRWTQSTV